MSVNTCPRCEQLKHELAQLSRDLKTSQRIVRAIVIGNTPSVLMHAPEMYQLLQRIYDDARLFCEFNHLEVKPAWYHDVETLLKHVNDETSSTETGV